MYVNDILTSNVKKVGANETQAKGAHSTSLNTDIDHSSDDRCIINHTMMEDKNQG